MNVYEKIMKVRYDLLKEDIKKSGYNKFSRFSYYELKDFLSTATKMFNDIKLYSKFSLIPANQVEQETVKFTIINIETPEEVEVYTLPSAECFIGLKKDGTGGADPIQNLGGRITYLRRYMYLIALDLIEDDSVDNKEQVGQPKPQSYIEPTPRYENEQDAITTETKKLLTSIMRKLENDDNKEFKGIVMKDICAKAKVDKWYDIKFDKDYSSKQLIEDVKIILEKEKALAKAGI